MVSSAYIHIPFCKSKCHYCSFVSFPNKIHLKKDYINALCKEIKNKYRNEKLKTLYFGGGTPSILTPEELSTIIDLFNISTTTEITAELNPDTVNQDYMNRLYDTGINRISLGCQTFNDNILKSINRIHNSQQIITAIKYAENAGFSNISLDLIYGLPNQSLELFIEDLNKAVRLDVKHISLYGLTIEDGCYFSKHIPQNLPNDDLQADMYLTAVDILKSYNFEHYEISNFSLDGYNSKHNLNYWDNNEYYGFGTSAHGYLNSCRYANTSSLELYIQNPLQPLTENFLTIKEQLEEEIFLGFRKSEGIDVYRINTKYNIDFEKKYSEILQKYLQYNYLKYDNGKYMLTPKGYLISNTILAEFI